MTCAAGVARAQVSAQSFSPSPAPNLSQPQARDTQAQGRDPSVPSLFEPHFEDRDGRPQRFRKPGTITQVSSGAGAIGFDATNARGKRKAKQQAQQRARAAAENAPVVQAAPDPTVAPVFQKTESPAAARRRATNSAPVSLDATGAVVARPIQRRIVDADPFAPVGNYWGTFLALPAIDITAGYNSNPGQRQNGTGSWYEKIAPELLLRSNWAQHALNAEFRGSYTWFNELENFSKPDLFFRADGRVDVTRDTKLEAEGRFMLAQDNPGDPNLPTSIQKPPLFTVSGGTVGVRQAFNRMEVWLRGSLDSTVYGNGTLNNGQSVSFGDRNYDQYGMKLRTSYEWMQGVTPFVEYGADVRKHDQADDQNGLNRNSSGQSIRVGTTFLLTGYLIGELAAGWLERTYVAPMMTPIRGPLFDASLTYFASPLTTVKLDMRTTVDESIINNVSGSFSHYYAMQIDHAFRRWLIGSVRFGYTNTDYVGSPRIDNYFALTTALTYKMSREWWLKGEYRREWLNSNETSADYVSNIFLLSLRLQR